MTTHTVSSDNLAPAMCAADCACAGGQPSLRCSFLPGCTRCAPSLVPSWVYRADMPPEADDEPFATVPARLLDASDEGYQSGLWLGALFLVVDALVAFVLGRITA